MKFSVYIASSVAILLLCISCTPAERVVNCDELTADNTDQCLRLNQIQVLGTHNSYKLDLPESLIQAIEPFSPGWSENIQYGHRTLTEQLANFGIRQFELDIFADTSGGRFSRPAGALLAGDSLFIDRTKMDAPGFKVLHVQDIDYRSTCLTLVACLTEIRDWSMQNPNHLPIMILVEMKDSPAGGRGDFPLTQPIPFTEDIMVEVDREIFSVFEEEHLITPYQVRGNHATLEEALKQDGWPTLAESRGRILLALDNTGRHRDMYLSLSPNLSGKAMFVSSKPGEPTAGFVKMNDVLNDFDEIVALVEQGMIIRTRSDIPNQEAKTGDTERRDRALSSGAQFVSTDYPEESPYGSGFIVKLPDATGPGRCNPVTAPVGCNNDWITE
ncbi:MAG: hypothetical protein HLUCCA01_10025 [Bacteroidetes bacterium HLUCCA01]|nr:MAG: hypothetical protein HLUCCA01_10025 [Bacteroidetes bacterium HLUCCA01]